MRRTVRVTEIELCENNVWDVTLTILETDWEDDTVLISHHCHRSRQFCNQKTSSSLAHTITSFHNSALKEEHKAKADISIFVVENTSQSFIVIHCVSFVENTNNLYMYICTWIHFKFKLNLAIAIIIAIAISIFQFYLLCVYLQKQRQVRNLLELCSFFVFGIWNLNLSICIMCLLI